MLSSPPQSWLGQHRPLILHPSNYEKKEWEGRGGEGRGERKREAGREGGREGRREGGRGHKKPSMGIPLAMLPG